MATWIWTLGCANGCCQPAPPPWTDCSSPSGHRGPPAQTQEAAVAGPQYSGTNLRRAVALLGRLQEAEPDRFSRAHLRTLQRRVQQWRGIMAQKLVYATAGEPMAGPAAMLELALAGVD